MRINFKRLKFHWKLGLAINIPIIIIFLIGSFFIAYLYEKSVINEAINVRLKKNYEFAYLSLIKGHENMPVHVYKIFKQEFLEKFPGIKIYPNENVVRLFGLESQEIKDEKIKVVLNQGKPIIVFKEKEKILYGYYPIKAKISCLVCHSNVSSDNILGAFSISIPLTSALKAVTSIKIFLFFMGFLAISLISFLLYIVYMRIGYRPIWMISQYLNSLSEGYLNFKVDKDILEQPDIIGELARSLQQLKEYLNNFNSKILDFSLKLTKQVDNVFKTVDSANKYVKASNMTTNEIELYVENIFRLISELSRKTIQINTLLRSLQNLTMKNSQPDERTIEELNKTITNLNTETIELIEKIEKLVQEEEKVSSLFEDVSQIFQNLNKTLDQINSFVYESLIISTYMKNIASSIRLENMEKIIFDIFETDLDRYLLRIESHIKGIESLDPVRWSDAKALSIGKWLETDEYNEFKKQIGDFDFDIFENLYKELFSIGKEIIIAYNREDYLTVNNNLDKFRKFYRELKGYLEELKYLYIEFMESRMSGGGTE